MQKWEYICIGKHRHMEEQVIFLEYRDEIVEINYGDWVSESQLQEQLKRFAELTDGFDLSPFLEKSDKRDKKGSIHLSDIHRFQTELLNHLGKRGWEMSGTENTLTDYTSHKVIYMKRPIG